MTMSSKSLLDKVTKQTICIVCSYYGDSVCNKV